MINKNSYTPIVLTLFLFSSSVFAQNISSTFFNKAVNETEVNVDARIVSLVEIEGINTVSLQSRIEKIDKVIGYIAPIFRNENTAKILSAIDAELFNPEQFRPRVDYTKQSIESRLEFVYRLASVFEQLDQTGISGFDSADLPASLKGFSFYSVAASIDYAKCLAIVEQIIASNGPSKSEELCNVPRLGKITKFDYKNTNQDDAESAQDSFVVSDMKTDLYRVVFDMESQSVQFVLEQQYSDIYEISVNVEQGFEESKRKNQRVYSSELATSSDVDPFLPPENPSNFNTKPSLPSKLLDFTGGSSLWARGLDHRLYVEGNSINIKKVTRTLFPMIPLNTETRTEGTYSDLSGKQFVRGEASVQTIDGEEHVVYELPKSNPIRQISSDTCIDILFSGEIPKTFLGFPNSQTGWCLGRCKHPIIENSV